MPTVMATSNINTAATANALTVTQPGDYELTYNVLAQLENAGNLTLAIRRNGVNIPGAVQTLELTAKEDEAFGGSVIVALAAGDIIDLAMTSTVNNTEGTVSQASLPAKKLN